MNRPLTLTRGRFTARFARSEGDLHAAQRLRFRCFRGGRQDRDARDHDRFDRLCRHVLIEDSATGQLVCCYRLLFLESGAEIARSYSAQYYELSGLAGFARPMVEMGRFCMDPLKHDPDILRLAWGTMTALVDRDGVEMLFGCSSFRGTDAAPYADAFALLRQRHVAPDCWRPGIKAGRVIEFSTLTGTAPDPRLAQSGMPPLLRTYLLMGGWVSDHAVIDPDLDTLHVFTGLEIRAVPAGRARLLRALAN
ncbi:GNAT family N-acetyltransferase [Nioella sediminis]|jgi:putative hemolysin|uniref:GNAT family N-acetyltransferase n=1 Tax=Nioella sediminis TaxID=1912092 RepID=UPI0008FD578D|nr:GNAT family N-acyltransferase [Nioella sediminis]TBX25956.1 ornithine-acyl-ACP acyltransferase [Roseovarius sp. JS7-11]